MYELENKCKKCLYKWWNKIMDDAYYLQFPSVLRKALQEGKVNLPDGLLREYEPLHVFRGIRYKKDTKEFVDKSDFLSQAERDLPNTDFDDIGSYSCSCFEDVDELIAAFSLPRKNKGIAEGMMTCELGARLDDEGWTHRHWFLYDGVDPSDDFKVYAYDYEKMDTVK